MAFKYLRYLSVLNAFMGKQILDAYRSEDVAPPILGNIALQAIDLPEYTLHDAVNYLRGLRDTCTLLYPQLEHLDFVQQAPRMEVPVYFATERYDVNAMATLVERYYAVLAAPTGSSCGSTMRDMAPTSRSPASSIPSWPPLCWPRRARTRLSRSSKCPSGVEVVGEAATTIAQAGTRRVVVLRKGATAVRRQQEALR